MLSIVNYAYSRRLLLNSSLNINYRGYLLVDKNSSSSILDLPDFGELVPIYEVLLFCLDRYFSTRDNAYAYDLSGDAFIPSSNNFFASVMLIKPKGEDFGFTAVHFKVIDSSIVRTSSEVVKFFFDFIKRRSIPLLLANIHPVFENPIAFVKECLATLERD